MSDFSQAWKASSPLNPYSPVQDSMDHNQEPIVEKVVPTPRKDLIITVGPNGNSIMVGDSDNPQTWQPAVVGVDYLTEVPPPIQFQKMDLSPMHTLFGMGFALIIIAIFIGGFLEWEYE